MDIEQFLREAAEDCPREFDCLLAWLLEQVGENEENQRAPTTDEGLFGRVSDSLAELEQEELPVPSTDHDLYGRVYSLLNGDNSPEPGTRESALGQALLRALARCARTGNPSVSAMEIPVKTTHFIGMCTPLVIAIAMRSPDLVQVLIEFRASVNASSLLTYPRRGGDAHERGTPGAEVSLHCSPLEAASALPASGCSGAIFVMLWRAGACPKRTPRFRKDSHYHYTALRMAAKTGNVMAQGLLKNMGDDREEGFPDLPFKYGSDLVKMISGRGRPGRDYADDFCHTM